jgi:hypothetical protein
VGALVVGAVTGARVGALVVGAVTGARVGALVVGALTGARVGALVVGALTGARVGAFVVGAVIVGAWTGPSCVLCALAMDMAARAGDPLRISMVIVLAAVVVVAVARTRMVPGVGAPAPPTLMARLEKARAFWMYTSALFPLKVRNRNADCVKISSTLYVAAADTGMVYRRGGDSPKKPIVLRYVW